MAELLVSELTTNAVVASAARSADPEFADRETDRWVSLTLRLLRDRLVIEVFDDNPNPPVPAFADAESENGRGLMLVEALSKEWGHFCPPSGGKTVFCVLGIPGGASALGPGHAPLVPIRKGRDYE